MAQTILDFIARVEPNKSAHLDALLAQIASNVPENSLIPFAKLPSLHFSSLVVFESSGFGPYLVWEHNFDGELNAYLDELLHNAAGLDQILSCCVGYSPAHPRNYILSHIVRPNTYHIGTVGRGVDRIRREANLRHQIEVFLDSKDFSGQSAEAVQAEIQRFVGQQPALAWAKHVEPRLTTKERILPYINIALAVLIALPFVPLLLIGLLLLRWHELRDKPRTELVASAHVRQLFETENFAAQNHLASITIVKPGLLRKMTLKFVLFAANLAARTSTSGQLSGIPTIHFAHWSVIDGGKRLLFLSNYGGSWGSYLDDFIDKASPGLTGIWTNTVGFPKTRFLVLEGSRDGPGFKNFARSSQSVTRVWYSAYTNLTVPNINSNSAFREGLYGSVDAKEWLRLL